MPASAPSTRPTPSWNAWPRPGASTANTRSSMPRIDLLASRAASRHRRSTRYFKELRHRAARTEEIRRPERKSSGTASRPGWCRCSTTTRESSPSTTRSTWSTRSRLTTPLRARSLRRRHHRHRRRQPRPVRHRHRRGAAGQRLGLLFRVAVLTDGRAAEGAAAPAARFATACTGRDRRRQPEWHSVRPWLGGLRQTATSASLWCSAAPWAPCP